MTLANCNASLSKMHWVDEVVHDTRLYPCEGICSENSVKMGCSKALSRFIRTILTLYRKTVLKFPQIDPETCF